MTDLLLWVFTWVYVLTLVIITTEMLFQRLAHALLGEMLHFFAKKLCFKLGLVRYGAWILFKCLF